MGDPAFVTSSLIGTYIEPNIIELYTPDSFQGVFTIEIVKEQATAIRNAIEEHQRVALLFEVPKVNISLEARRFVMQNTDFATAIAFVTTSVATRMIANFVLLVRNDEVPMKSFTEKEEALLWLKGKLKTGSRK